MKNNSISLHFIRTGAFSVSALTFKVSNTVLNYLLLFMVVAQEERTSLVAFCVYWVTFMCLCRALKHNYPNHLMLGDNLKTLDLM